MTHGKNENGQCCPKFEPEPWQEKTHVWNEKLFIKDSIPLFMHIPWPPMVGKVLGKLWKKAQEAQADPDPKDVLFLAYDPSPWKGEYYLSVNKEVPQSENVRLTGTFLTKVFDGPYNAVPKWVKVMDKYVADQGKSVKKYYFHYTTCPKCAKFYGHNYVIAFAQVE